MSGLLHHQQNHYALSDYHHHQMFLIPKNKQTFVIIKQTFALYNNRTVIAEIGDHLARTDMGRKVWGASVPLFVGGSWVPI